MADGPKRRFAHDFSRVPSLGVPPIPLDPSFSRLNAYDFLAPKGRAETPSPALPSVITWSAAGDAIASHARADAARSLVIETQTNARGERTAFVPIAGAAAAVAAVATTGEESDATSPWRAHHDGAQADASSASSTTSSTSSPSTSSPSAQPEAPSGRKPGRPANGPNAKKGGANAGEGASEPAADKSPKSPEKPAPRRRRRS